jgi:hypothetical protein
MNQQKYSIIEWIFILCHERLFGNNSCLKQAHLFPTLNLAIIGTDPTRYLVEQISQGTGVFQEIMLSMAKSLLF